MKKTKIRHLSGHRLLCFIPTATATNQRTQFSVTLHQLEPIFIFPHTLKGLSGCSNTTCTLLISCCLKKNLVTGFSTSILSPTKISLFKQIETEDISFFYLSFLNAFYKLLCDVACKYYLIRQLLNPNNSSLLFTSHWDAQSYLASGLGPSLHFSGMLVLAHSSNWHTVWYKSSLVTSYRSFSYHPTGSALTNYSHSESLFCVPLSLSEMDEFN